MSEYVGYNARYEQVAAKRLLAARGPVAGSLVIVLSTQSEYRGSVAATRGDAPRGRPSFPTDRASAVWIGKMKGSIMTTGTIKKVVADRGFGFIAAEDGKEYFFHRGGVQAPLEFDRLVGGERVSFEIETSPKGPRAIQVSAA
jgi:cold shock protein